MLRSETIDLTSPGCRIGTFKQTKQQRILDAAQREAAGSAELGCTQRQRCSLRAPGDELPSRGNGRHADALKQERAAAHGFFSASIEVAAPLDSFL